MTTRPLIERSSAAMRIARSLNLWSALFIISVPFLFTLRVEADPRLALRVIDTSAIPRDTGYLGIYLTNPLDTVSGFELTLLVDKPELMGFLPSFDTSHTLTNHWEYFHVELVTLPMTGIKIYALATLAPPVKPGIPPASSPRLLLKIPFHAGVIPDSAVDRIATISIAQGVDDFGFSSREGQLIGLAWDTIYDTACFRCTNRDPEGGCMTYAPASPPCDSISVSQTTFNPHFDTSVVSFRAGSVTLLPDCHPTSLAGDVNGSGTVDSADLSFLGAFVQYGTVTLARPDEADLNQDSCINWVDYELLDQYLHSAPGTVTLPSCVRAAPARCCCLGERGNVTNDQADVIDVSDLSLLIAYLSGSVSTLPCSEKADTDGSGGRVDVADLSRLVSFLSGSGVQLAPCPH
jgi:hypothetical protein